MVFLIFKRRRSNSHSKISITDLFFQLPIYLDLLGHDARNKFQTIFSQMVVQNADYHGTKQKNTLSLKQTNSKKSQGTCQPVNKSNNLTK